MVERGKAIGGLFGVVLVAAVISGPLLVESAYYDEMWTLSAMGEETFGGFWRAHQVSDPPAALAPIYFVLLWGWLKVVGFGVGAARAFSFLCGLMTIPLVYLIGRRVHSDAAGLVAAGFAAVSLMHVHYSVEIRMYALTMVLALGSVWTLLRVHDAPTRSRLAAHVMVNALLVWTHLFAAALLPVQLLFLIAARGWGAALRRWLTAHVALGVLLVGWVVWQWSAAADDVASWFTPPTWRELANAFVVYGGGRYTNWDPSVRLPWGLSLDVVLLGALILLGAIGARRLSLPAAMLLVGWAVLPALLIFVESVLFRPVFVYRYALYSGFALWLLAGVGVATLPRAGWRWAAGVFVAALFCYQLLVIRMPLRPDYGAAARAVAADGAIIAFKDYNARGLVFNGAIAAERVSSVDDEAALYGAVEAAVTRDGEAHVVFWRWMRLEAFERYLDANDLIFERVDHGGLPPMYRYVIRYE